MIRSVKPDSGPYGKLIRAADGTGEFTGLVEGRPLLLSKLGHGIDAR